MSGKQIKLFLIDATPGGLTTAEITNWTGRGKFGARSAPNANAMPLRQCVRGASARGRPNTTPAPASVAMALHLRQRLFRHSARRTVQRRHRQPVRSGPQHRRRPGRRRLGAGDGDRVCDRACRGRGRRDAGRSWRIPRCRRCAGRARPPEDIPHSPLRDNCFARLGQAGGVNWLSVNSAPCGSRTNAVFVHWVSSDATTVAPRRSASAAEASRSATAKETCQ